MCLPVLPLCPTNSAVAFSLKAPFPQTDFKARTRAVKAAGNALLFISFGGLMRYLKMGVFALALVVTVYATRTTQVTAAGDFAGGNAGLKSAGAPAFGPGRGLFVGDSIGGAVAAIETGDRTAASTAQVNAQGIDEKLAP